MRKPNRKERRETFKALWEYLELPPKIDHRRKSRLQRQFMRTYRETTGIGAEVYKPKISLKPKPKETWQRNEKKFKARQEKLKQSIIVWHSFSSA